MERSVRTSTTPGARLAELVLETPGALYLDNRVIMILGKIRFRLLTIGHKDRQGTRPLLGRGANHAESSGCGREDGPHETTGVKRF